MKKTMNVATRLGLGFGVVVVFLLLVSFVGLSRMATINEATRVMSEERWPRTEQAYEISARANAIAIALRNMMLTSSQENAKAQKALILENRQGIREIVAHLTEVVNLPKGKELLQQIKNARQAYVDGQDTLISLISLIENNAIDESRQFLEKDLQPSLQAYQAAIGNFIQFQGEMMVSAGDEAHSTYVMARNLMFGIVGAAILFAILIAFMITRSLMRSVGEVSEAASLISSASEQVSSAAQSLSSSTSEQAAGLEETSAAMEQITASISQNADNAKVTDGIANKAAQDAQTGGKAVVATVAAMHAIAGKIRIVDEIAYQTNLLALNAAIEAARAGEHGKGFAVVAAEVRKLAERSQVAAQEIGELANSSVKTAESAGKLLEDMVPAIRKTADLVQEIAAASNEQTSGANQINQAMMQFNQLIQQNASASEELAATAEEMSSQAEQLQAVMAELSGKDSQEQAPAMTRQQGKGQRQPAYHRTTHSNLKARTAAKREDETRDYVRF